MATSGNGATTGMTGTTIRARLRAILQVHIPAITVSYAAAVGAAALEAAGQLFATAAIPVTLSATLVFVLFVVILSELNC